MEELVWNQSINWIFLNINMSVVNMYIFKFLINYRHFVTIGFEWQHLIWNNQCKCCCVGGNIFSEICLYLNIDNRGFEVFFLISPPLRLVPVIWSYSWYSYSSMLLSISWLSVNFNIFATIFNRGRKMIVTFKPDSFNRFTRSWIAIALEALNDGRSIHLSVC